MNRKTNFILLISIIALAFMSCDRKADSSQNKKINIADSNAVVAESTPESKKSIQVDIFYLPHPPAIAIVKKVEETLRKYPSVKISYYDFFDPKNAEKIKAYKITKHSPIIIFIDNKSTFTIDGRQLEFKNFPKGDAFIPEYEGVWTYEDIEKAIASK